MKREEIEFFNSRPVSWEGNSDEGEHFYICEWCGEVVDYRRLGDVLAHDEPHSEPPT